MRSKNYFLALVLLVAFGLLRGQNISGESDWVSLMHNPDANFYDIQKAFNEYWKNKNVKEKGKGWKQFKRWEWFMEPRLYPHGDRSVMNRAMAQYLNTLKSSAKGQSQNKAANWTYIGNTTVPSNGGGAGRINFVRFHPTNANIIFVGAPAGGLWKTTNGGTSWSVLNTDQLASIGCSDLAINPNNPNIMYLATGDGDGADTYSIGVLKTTDGGLTWNATGLSWNVTQTRTIRRMIINPQNPNTLLAATSNGIYKTTNGGNSWTQVTTGSFFDIEYKPGDTTIVYACSDQFYRSTNGGNSFSLITNGLPSSSSSSRMAIAVTPANSAYVYVLVGNQTDYGLEGFYRSTNSGTSFTLMANSPNLLGWSTNGSDQGGQAWYDLAIAASPTNANVVFVGGVNIWKTTNGGSSWSLNAHWYGGGGAPYVHADIHDLVFYPGSGTTVFAGCDGGVFKTTNTGSSWSDISSNLQIGQIYRIGNSATNANRIISGWQDNGTNLKNNTNWSQVIGGDGMECIIDYTNANIMYGEIYYGEIYKSTDGGNSWTNIVGSGGTGVDEDGGWVTPYVMHPTNNQTLLVGKSVVYRSTNGGSSWTTLGSLPGGTGTVRAIAYAPSNPNIFYVAKSNKLYQTTNGGTSFVDKTGSLPVTQVSITGIAVSNTDANRVYVTFSGYNASHKVYYTTDGGNTWTNISTGLPNLPTTCIVYENGSPNRIYVGTDAGVYYRDDNSGGWVAYNTGLPNVVITELEIHYGTGKIRAATFGRGLWESDLYTPTNSPPVADFTAFPTSGCPGSVVSFTDLSTLNPTSWSWSLNPSSGFTYVSGTNASSQNPVIQFNVPGTYTVTLTATNTYGSDTETKNAYITIQTGLTPPLTEGFQNATFPPSGYTNLDGGNDSYVWELNTSVGGYGASTQCAYFNNYVNNSQGAFDALITPPLDFSSAISASLSFDVAYARYSATYSDTLEVLISTDCGVTFSSVWIQGGTTLATAPDNTNAFTPSSNQWATKNINLNAYLGQNDIVIAFRNRGHWGNNLYLDNINIQVSISTPPTANMTVTGQANCPGDCLTFTDNSTNNPTGWQWTFPGGTPSSSTQQNPGQVCFNTPGNYICTLIVSNNYGSDTITYAVSINTPPPVPTISQNGNTLTCNQSGFNYQWSLNGNAIPGATGQSYTISQSGDYTVTITDANGCSATSAIFTANYSTGINGPDYETLRIIPNPASTAFIIRSEDPIQDVYIYDATGKILYHQVNILKKEFLIQFPLSSGMYWVKINLPHSSQIQKLVIK